MSKVATILAAVVIGFMMTESVAYALNIDALSESDLTGLVPTNTIGNGPADPPGIGGGVQGVGGQPFFLDSNGVVDDDDDPIAVPGTFDIYLGPATVTDVHSNVEIDALLMTVTFDVSSGQSLLSVNLSELGGASAILTFSDFHTLSSLGFASGGGGDSFNPAADDLVGAFLITDVNLNAGNHVDIGDFTISVPGFTTDYKGTYRIDLFGIDQSYEFTSPAGGGEIVAAGSNSAGGYLVPEPGSLMIIGSVLLGIGLKKRFC